MCLGSILSVIFTGSKVNQVALIFQSPPLHVRINRSLETLRSLLPPEGRRFQNVENGSFRTCGTIPRVCRGPWRTFHDGRLREAEISFCIFLQKVSPDRANLNSRAGRNGTYLFV